MTLFEEGEPQQNWPTSFTENNRSLIELYQLEEENVVGKRYLTLGLLYQLIGRLSKFAKAQTSRQLKRTAAQYKETLQRLNDVFEYIDLITKKS